MLASLVADWITHNAGVVTLTLAMLTEFVWRAELAIPAFTIVLANATTTTFFTPAAYTPVRALASLTFDFGSYARCTPDMFSTFYRVDPP